MSRRPKEAQPDSEQITAFEQISSELKSLLTNLLDDETKVDAVHFYVLEISSSDIKLLTRALQKIRAASEEITRYFEIYSDDHSLSIFLNAVECKILSGQDLTRHIQELNSLPRSGMEASIEEKKKKVEIRAQRRKLAENLKNLLSMGSEIAPRTALLFAQKLEKLRPKLQFDLFLLVNKYLEEDQNELFTFYRQLLKNSSISLDPVMKAFVDKLYDIAYDKYFEGQKAATSTPNPQPATD